MAKRRRLPGFVLPLRKRAWDQLRFDGASWSLRARREPQFEQPLRRVQLAIEFGDWRCLRLQCEEHGWRRFFPRELHLLVCRTHADAIWPLIGAALALHQGRPWLGR